MTSDGLLHQVGSSGSNTRQHRLPISAVNEVDEEKFPDITYLHSSVAGDGVELEMAADFLVGCADSGPGCCSNETLCGCCREQLVQSGGIVYVDWPRLRLMAVDGALDCR